MEWPVYLSHWLTKHGVSPKNVSVVLQLARRQDLGPLEAAFKHELDRSFLNFNSLTPQVINYCGLNIEFRCLPAIFSREK